MASPEVNTHSTCEKSYELSTDQRMMLRTVAVALGDMQQEATADDVDPDVAEILVLCRSALLGLCGRLRTQPRRGDVIRMRLQEVNRA